VKQYKVYLCGTGDSPLIDKNPDCPNAAAHTPSPSSDLDFADWATAMTKGFRQTRCSGCGLFNIWVPRGR
jgi:hypothetical protein